MQLYSIKLPRGVVTGVLTEANSSHKVSLPKDIAITPLFDFCEKRTFTPGGSQVCLQSVYQITERRKLRGRWQIDRRTTRLVFWSAGYPRKGRTLGGHLSQQPGAKGMRYDELSQLSPTADFVGPGDATFSLPPAGERALPIAFYCYKLTPVKTIRTSTQPIK
jgi:hypothetical protein